MTCSSLRQVSPGGEGRPVCSTTVAALRRLAAARAARAWARSSWSLLELNTNNAGDWISFAMEALPSTVSESRPQRVWESSGSDMI